MIQTSSEIEKARALTLEGLDDSHDALEALKDVCGAAASRLKTDMFNSAESIKTAVESVHQFIVFEQQVVELFEVDAESVATDADSLWQAELDMHHLLVQFNTKSDAMDFVGVSELLGCDMPDLLGRFQALLPLLKESIREVEIV